MISTMFLDVDGTLTNNYHIHTAGWKNILSLYGKILPDNFFDKLHGADTRQAIFEVIRAADISTDTATFEELITIKNRIRDGEIAKLSEKNVFNGVRDFLEDIKKNNIRIVCAAITSACKPILEQLGLMLYFDDFICGSEMNPLKSKSAKVFLNYLSQKKINRYSSCIIDDDYNVAIRAHQAGLKSIWFTKNETITFLRKLSSFEALTYSKLENQFDL